MTDHDEVVARTVTVLGLLAIALIHILELPDTLGDQAYVGWLFIAAIVSSLLLAAILTRTNDSRAWTVTGAFAALVLIAFLFSRVTGLPGFTDYKGVWDDPSGLRSMVVEGLVVLVSCAVLATRSPAFARQLLKTRDRSGQASRPGPAALG
jgi:Na+/proline symporter